MDSAQAPDGYLVSEVRIEQWVLAALRMQHALALRPGRRVRRRARPAVRAPRARRSLWLLLGISSLGLCLL